MMLPPPSFYEWMFTVNKPSWDLLQAVTAELLSMTAAWLQGCWFSTFLML